MQCTPRDVQQTHVAVRYNIELFPYSFLSVISLYEWGLQIANGVTMPTNVSTLNTEDVDGSRFSSSSHIVVMAIQSYQLKAAYC